MGNEVSEWLNVLDDLKALEGHEPKYSKDRKLD